MALIFNQFDLKKLPKCKIELHVHLDGAMRLTTIWELAQKKRIDIKSKTLEELFNVCTVSKPSTLSNFLKGFEIVMPVVRNDMDAVERIAYEFCEDMASQGVVYAEVRYNPHLFCDPPTKKSARLVIDSVVKGLKRGEVDCDIKVRTILCCIRGKSEWSQDVLDFCQEFKDSGVVGIDIAGDEAMIMASSTDIKIFQEAALLGIHRTAHAAEAGPATNLTIAIDDMKAERIGHGYHVVDNDKIFQRCLDERIHFETCPYSSLLTGSVPLSSIKHPITKFAEDKANFSISRDDPFIIQKTLDEEYALLRNFGFTEAHFTQATFNAARSCFLPKNEKEDLIKKISKIYGIDVPGGVVVSEECG